MQPSHKRLLLVPLPLLHRDVLAGQPVWAQTFKWYIHIRQKAEEEIDLNEEHVSEVAEGGDGAVDATDEFHVLRLKRPKYSRPLTIILLHKPARLPQRILVMLVLDFNLNYLVVRHRFKNILKFCEGFLICVFPLIFYRSVREADRNLVVELGQIGEVGISHPLTLPKAAIVFANPFKCLVVADNNLLILRYPDIRFYYVDSVIDTEHETLHCVFGCV